MMLVISLVTQTLKYSLRYVPKYQILHLSPQGRHPTRPFILVTRLVMLTRTDLYFKKKKTPKPKIKSFVKYERCFCIFNIHKLFRYYQTCLSIILFLILLKRNSFHQKCLHSHSFRAILCLRLFCAFGTGKRYGKEMLASYFQSQKQYDIKDGYSMEHGNFMKF